MSTHLLLGSHSPRRQSLLKQMSYEFEVVANDMEEVIPDNIPLEKICTFLAHEKSKHLRKACRKTDVLLTVDTTVIDYKRKQHLGKPKDQAEAFEMLKSLSENRHFVISGLCFSCGEKEIIQSCKTEVEFVHLSDAQIRHYIEHHKPFDKAGSYGIQEWIGMVGISSIVGSFYNVMGLPTHLVFQTLKSEFNILPQVL